MIALCAVLLTTNDAFARRRHVGGPMPSYVLQSVTAGELKPTVCTDSKTKEKMRSVMFQALDLALNDYVMNLFESWMKDASGQPARAKLGIDKSVEAYVHAQRAIALWDVLLCEKD